MTISTIDSNSSSLFSTTLNLNSLKDVSIAIDYSERPKKLSFWQLTTTKLQQIYYKKDVFPPDSSRSVTFKDASSWLFIDEEVDDL